MQKGSVGYSSYSPCRYSLSVIDFEAYAEIFLAGGASPLIVVHEMKGVVVGMLWVEAIDGISSSEAIGALIHASHRIDDVLPWPALSRAVDYAEKPASAVDLERRFLSEIARVEDISRHCVALPLWAGHRPVPGVAAKKIARALAQASLPDQKFRR